MEVLKYYAELRIKLLEVITGVQDSGWSLYWDDTTPNWETKSNLQEVFSRYFEVASREYGIYKVTRHADCPNEKHDDVDGGYPTTSEHGFDIKYQDPRFKWTFYQTYQGERWCVCPCSPKNKPTNHWVIDDIVYDQSNELDFDVEELIGILNDVLSAIDSAGDKRPRSAIRECLLSAVIRINDQLLPMPMDKFISKYIEPKGAG